MWLKLTVLWQWLMLDGGRRAQGQDNVRSHVAFCALIVVHWHFRSPLTSGSFRRQAADRHSRGAQRPTGRQSKCSLNMYPSVDVCLFSSIAVPGTIKSRSVNRLDWENCQAFGMLLALVQKINKVFLNSYDLYSTYSSAKKYFLELTVILSLNCLLGLASFVSTIAILKVLEGCRGGIRKSMHTTEDCAKTNEFIKISLLCSLSEHCTCHVFHCIFFRLQINQIDIYSQSSTICCVKEGGILKAKDLFVFLHDTS